MITKGTAYGLRDVRREHDPLRGTVTWKRAEGTAAAVKALEAAAISAGYRYVLDLHSVPAYIEIAYPFGGDGVSITLQSVWELDSIEEKLSVWDAPGVVALVSSMTTNGAAQFKRDVQSALDVVQVQLSGDPTATLGDIEASVYFARAIAAYASVGELFKRLVLERQGNYERSRPVLRNTTTYPPSWSYTVSYTTIGKQISTTNLETAESTIPFDLPSSKYWLIKYPRITQLSDGRVQCVREWHEGDRDSFYYTEYTPPPS